MMIYIILYVIGILVARVQLHYWMKDRILLDEDYKTIAVLSALSWTIYPAYIINTVIDSLNTR